MGWNILYFFGFVVFDFVFLWNNFLLIFFFCFLFYSLLSGWSCEWLMGSVGVLVCIIMGDIKVKVRVKLYVVILCVLGLNGNW